MLKIKYLFFVDSYKTPTMEVGAHDVGAFGSPWWKKLKEIRFHLSEASWVYTAWSKLRNG